MLDYVHRALTIYAAGQAIGLDGILGAPIFRSYRVIFDVQRKQLHLLPSDKRGVP